jgi:signal transduction histidine kinase
LTLLALAAVRLDPPAIQYARPTEILAALWTLYSAALLLWVASRSLPPSALIAIHMADMMWPTLIITVSHSLKLLFGAVYSFVLISAGFRWGFSEAVLTALAGGVIIEVEGLLLGATAEGIFEHGRLLIRCGYMLVLGCLIGILGENEKERSAEAAVVTRMVHAARSTQSMRTALQAAFNELIGLFRPSHLSIAAQELATDRVHLLQEPGSGDPVPLPYVKELLGDDRLEALLPGLPETFFCRRSSSGRWRLITPGERPRECELPRIPWLAQQPGSLLGISAGFGSEWRLRLVLADARLGYAARKELRFARTLFERAAPAIYEIYLMRRLRARASALERARVARELHDGAIQSLISTEMRAGMLLRRAEREFPAIAGEIASLQELLREQVFDLRELMQQLKPVEIEPNRLIEHLSEVVERFRRETGTPVRFTVGDGEVSLLPHACREVLLILQEALVNIRKHAHAAEVLITFGMHDGDWQLDIQDNGTGFAFEGTLEGTELMSSAKGPAIIKERVANLGGKLVIESKPSQGSHLMIKIPQGSVSNGKQSQDNHDRHR